MDDGAEARRGQYFLGAFKCFCIFDFVVGLITLYWPSPWWARPAGLPDLVGLLWLLDAGLCARLCSQIRRRPPCEELQRAARLNTCSNVLTLVLYVVIVVPILRNPNDFGWFTGVVTVAFLANKARQICAIRAFSSWVCGHWQLAEGLAAAPAPAPAPSVREAPSQPQPPAAVPAPAPAPAPTQAAPAPAARPAAAAAAPEIPHGHSGGQEPQDCQAMQIQVPEGTLPGQTIAVRWADGRTYHLVLPERLPESRILLVARSPDAEQGRGLQVLQ